jgi:hypothetical protein
VSLVAGEVRSRRRTARTHFATLLDESTNRYEHALTYRGTVLGVSHIRESAPAWQPRRFPLSLRLIQH